MSTGGHRGLRSIVLACLLAALPIAATAAVLATPIHADEASPDDKIAVPQENALFSSTEMIVVFREDTSEAEIAETIQEAEAADPEGEMVDADRGTLNSPYVIDTPMDEVVVSVVIDEDTPFEDAAAEIAASEDVVYVQPNYIYVLNESEAQEAASEGLGAMADETLVDAGTDDPFTYSGGANNWHLGAIKARGAWDRARTEGAVTVAVVDTGCDLEHIDLVDNLDIEHAYQAASSGGTSFTYRNATYTFAVQAAGPLTTSFGNRGDLDTHGTHTCGIVGATANNGIGVAGVSYNATVLPINIFTRATSENGEQVITADTATVVSAYSYLFGLVDSGSVQNLRIINMSLGGYEDSDNDIALHGALAKALADYGILTVVSGGNDGTGKNSWPSDYDECIAVTAIQKEGWETDPTRAGYSDHNSAKDIAAPGSSILSTLPNDAYGTKQGTSMAAPMVSGTLALMFAADPSLSAEAARSILYETATDLMDEGRDDYTGWGLVDAEAAIARVLGNAGGDEPDPGESEPDDPSRPIADGVYLIESDLQAGMLVDVVGQSTEDGGNIATWRSNGGTNQQFSIIWDADGGAYTIRNANSGLLMDVEGASTESGANVIQWPPNGGLNQRWRIVADGDGYRILSALDSELALAARSPFAKAGADIGVSTADGGNNQLFHLLPIGDAAGFSALWRTVEDGVYTVSPVHAPHLRLDISGASVEDGGDAIAWTAHGGTNQQFRIVWDGGTGYYRISSVNSGKRIDVSGASSENGADVIQWASNGGLNQFWDIQQRGDAYVLVSALRPDLVLDITGQSTEAGANVEVWTDNGGSNQLFMLSAL